MQQTDVLAVALAATGTAVTGRCRVKGYHIASDAGSANIVFRDGSASGATRLSVGVSSALPTCTLTLPGEGILFYNGVHVTLPASTTVTVFYG